jgi:hypothetical protein
MQTPTRKSTGPLQQKNECLRQFLLIALAPAIARGGFTDSPVPTCLSGSRPAFGVTSARLRMVFGGFAAG